LLSFDRCWKKNRLREELAQVALVFEGHFFTENVSRKYLGMWRSRILTSKVFIEDILVNIKNHLNNVNIIVPVLKFDLGLRNNLFLF